MQFYVVHYIIYCGILKRELTQSIDYCRYTTPGLWNSTSSAISFFHHPGNFTVINCNILL